MLCFSCIFPHSRYNYDNALGVFFFLVTNQSCSSSQKVTVQTTLRPISVIRIQLSFARGTSAANMVCRNTDIFQSALLLLIRFYIKCIFFLFSKVLHFLIRSQICISHNNVQFSLCNSDCHLSPVLYNCLPFSYFC